MGGLIAAGAVLLLALGEGEGKGAIPPRFISVAVGDHHTCAVLDAGRVACWGGNDRKQIPAAASTGPRQRGFLPGVDDAIAVEGSGDYTCALRRNGAATCWGVGFERPQEWPDLGAVELRVERDYACSRRRQGTVTCWTPGAHAVTPIKGLNDAVQMGVADMHSGCALTRAGRVRCWGERFAGDYPADLQRSFAVIDQVRDAVEIRVNYYTVYVRTRSGRVFGARGTMPPFRFVPVPGLIDAGALVSWNCARRRGGATVCWVDPWDWREMRASGLQPDPRLDGLHAVARGPHTCGIDASGALFCWGGNEEGQLGYDTPTVVRTPVDVVGLPPVRQLAADRDHTCALTSDGRVFCWGKIDEAWWPSSDAQATPIAVAGLDASQGLTFIGASADETWVVGAGGTTASWRGVPLPDERVWLSKQDATLRTQNWLLHSSQVLSGTHNPDPRRVVKVEDAAIVVEESYAPCYVSRAGAFVCFRSHDQRRNECHGDVCGPEGPPPALVPETIMVGVAAAASAGDCLCLAQESGGVLCHGKNAYGVLGENGGVESRALVAVPGLDHIRALATSTYHACAVRDDGRVLCWGAGRLGLPGSDRRAQQGEKADASVVAVPGIDDAKDVAVGAFHTCVLRRDGRVSCFGNNERGQLGSGTAGQNPNPRPVTLDP